MMAFRGVFVSIRKQLGGVFIDAWPEFALAHLLHEYLSAFLLDLLSDLLPVLDKLGFTAHDVL